MNLAPSVPFSNAPCLSEALDALARIFGARLGNEELAPDGTLAVGYFDDGSPLGVFLGERRPNLDELILLFLALAPHVRPTLLDNVVGGALGREREFPALGGERDEGSRALLPTGEIAAFLLAGDDLDGRFAVQRLFAPDHWFAREGILWLEPPKEDAPILSGRIIMARDWVERFTVGTVQAPAFGAAFPARRISTVLAWEDLVLGEPVRQQIAELENWVRHGRAVMEDWGMAGRLPPGYRALFHGPAGTGKTLTATLLGKATGREVYRVDLSTVVSKFIGETEKNLSALFDRAQNRDWILFFDEADALFGKRTNVKDAHDRYANQEVSYLLQRVEEFDGLVILATNLRANMDEAFLRRFNAIIRFPFPSEAERHAIWRRALPDRPGRADLARLLARFELSGGNIVNVVQFAAVEAIAAGGQTIHLSDALKGIRRELEKEGRVFRNLIEDDESETDTAA